MRNCGNTDDRDQSIPGDGDRLLLINDHANQPRQNQIGYFHSWERKLAAAYQFLFAADPASTQNLANLAAYLHNLGASEDEVCNPAIAEQLVPEQGALSLQSGAIDVLRHDFGPNLLQANIRRRDGRQMPLSIFCAFPMRPSNIDLRDSLPRHRELINWLMEVAKPKIERS